MPSLGMANRPGGEPLKDLWPITAESHWFSVLGKHPVMGWVQCPTRSHGGGFLAIDRSDCANATLALQAPQTVASDASLDHLAEHADQVFVMQGWRHGQILVAHNRPGQLPFPA